MRYYEGHESVCRKMREKGCRCWDEHLGQADGFDAFCLREFIEEALSRWTRPWEEQVALEVGCGTGPVCCFLAERGFRVEGVDVPATGENAHGTFRAICRPG